MRHLILAEDAPGTAYIVAAPQPCDALTATLRAAFDTGGGQPDQFSDLLRALDTIEIAPQQI